MRKQEDTELSLTPQFPPFLWPLKTLLLIHEPQG